VLAKTMTAAHASLNVASTAMFDGLEHEPFLYQ
jgi:hypothetical protein